MLAWVMGSRRNQRRSAWRGVQAGRWCAGGVVLVLALGLFVLAGPAVGSAGRAAGTSTYDVVLDYSGTYQGEDVGRSDDVTLKWDESRPVTLTFGDGAYQTVNQGPAMLTASGSIVGQGPSDAGNEADACTISAAGPENVALDVTSGNETTDGGSVVNTIDVQAGLPSTVSSFGQQLVVTGNNDNCFAGTYGGDSVIGGGPGGDCQAAFQSAEIAMGNDIDLGKLPFAKSFPVDCSNDGEHVSVTDSLTVTGSCGPSASGSARDAVASSEAMSCSVCPNPADDPLPGQARRRGEDITGEIWGGGRDPKQGDSYLEQLMKDYARKLRREYPVLDGPDREERKRLANEERDKLDKELARLRDETIRGLDSAETQDVARAMCPETKQEIHLIYTRWKKSLDEDYEGDLKFIANEVIGAVNLFCGCHL
jgi:hypothetical protein